jgi:hypothetical protein
LRNPYAVTVMCLTLVMLGAVATSMIPIDILPAFKSPAVQVLTFYGGMNRMERWVGQDAPSGQALHDAAQIIEVPGQPIHAVHHHRVALAHEGQQRFQLRALSILARCRVGRAFVPLWETPHRGAIPRSPGNEYTARGRELRRCGAGIRPALQEIRKSRTRVVYDA